MTAPNLSIGYGYDAAGNRTRLIYPDGRVATSGYNGANQPTSIRDWSGGLTTLAYDGHGRLITTTLPSGVTSVHRYDRSGLPTSIRHVHGASVLGQYTSTYDASGRRVGAIEDSRVITATYDGLYRLLGQQDNTGASYTYTYDAAGNRLSAVEPSGSTTATYDAANQLLTRNGLLIQHDANGNLLSDGTQSYTYDALDRLVQVTRGITTTTFGYNGNGDRLWQEVNGQRTSFTLDLTTALTQVLAQTGGGATTYLLPGVGQQVNGAWQYQHTDVLGSVRMLSDPAGQVLASMRYTPFGVLEAQSGPMSVFGFTGEPSDPAGDLLYLRARFYHPGIGRFLTPDSLIPDPTNGQAWNRYAYVYNDPANLVDPSGHVAIPLLVRIGGMVLGLHLFGRGVDSAANLNPHWRKEWFGTPGTCICSFSNPAPGASDDPFAVIPNLMGGALGGALSIGGLAADMGIDETVERVPRHLQLRYKIRGIEGVRGQSGVVIRPSVKVDPRFFVPKRGELPLPGLAGSLAIGGIIDAFLQLLFDANDPCLSPSQRMWNALNGASWGMLAGGFGAGVSYKVLQHAAKTGRYAAAPLATNVRAVLAGTGAGALAGMLIDRLTAD